MSNKSQALTDIIKLIKSARLNEKENLAVKTAVKIVLEKRQP